MYSTFRPCYYKVIRLIYEATRYFDGLIEQAKYQTNRNGLMAH